LHDPSFPVIAFDESDVRRCLPGSFEKGRPYQRQGAVRELRADKGGQRLIASVKGTRPRPYHVFVEIEDSDPVSLSARCSCPVGWNCKHAAAVLLEALHKPPSIEAAVEDPLSGALGGWLQQLRVAAQPPASPEAIVYRLDGPPQPGTPFAIDLRVVRVLKSGGWGADRAFPSVQLQNTTANYVTPADRAIIQLLRGGSWNSQLQLPEDPEITDLAMRRIIATGRCRWQDVASSPLVLGSARRGRLGWHIDADGRQTLGVALDEEAAIVLPSASPWYVVPGEHLAGPVELDLARPLVKVALSAPPVTKAEAAAIGSVFDRDLSGLALPRPRSDFVEEIRKDPPVPTLMLFSRKRSWSYWEPRSKNWDDGIDLALLGFTYGGTTIDPDDRRSELRAFEEGRIIVRRRNRAAERAALGRLEGFGLRDIETFEERRRDAGRMAFGFSEGQPDWPSFIYDVVPQLEREGWQIAAEESFRHHVVDGAGEWTAELEEGAGWWFSLDLGIDVDGERLALLPVLMSLLTRLRDMGTPDGLEALAHNGTVFGRLDDGRHVALPLERTKAIMATLVELYHPGTVSGTGKLEISAGEMTGLTAFEAATQLRWLGGERLRALAERLSNFSGIEKIEPPAGLRTELRPYQRDGLDWLQFLRGYELGGILADDMGLGKTVQALAHILVEKREGRLERPCLVVCPTSVVPNWLAEAARLAPELRVLSLHGTDRAQRFAEIGDADLVLTTYALLPRDAHHLLPISWHMAVLDEAQAIKNATAKTTQLVCRLDTRHRLCLTGTPMETISANYGRNSPF
jgi:SNF2-related domain/SWIM zinc finger